MRRALAPALAGSLLALSGCGGDEGEDPEAGAPPRTRIASVRIYQHDSWTVPGQTPRSVGAALARLRPTLVTNLIRFDAGETPEADEVAAWTTVRRAVLAASPGAHFGVELNALEYKTPAAVEREMAAVRSKLANEGWFFDFYTPAYRLHPEVAEAAIASAHANGEWIGGNVFGLANDPPVPPGSDYLAVQDFNFKIDLAAVRALAAKIPVAFHMENSPGDPQSDGCVFMRRWTTARREAYVRMRAAQQAANEFRFAYPVLFPECDFGPRGVISYDAISDGSMLQAIGSLMDRYDPDPG